MTESNADFIKRVRPQVSQYETTLIEALDRLADAEAQYNVERDLTSTALNALHATEHICAVWERRCGERTSERDAARSECERLRREVDSMNALRSQIAPNLGPRDHDR